LTQISAPSGTTIAQRRHVGETCMPLAAEVTQVANRAALPFRPKVMDQL
jgi:hypothetical protein